MELLPEFCERPVWKSFNESSKIMQSSNFPELDSADDVSGCVSPALSRCSSTLSDQHTTQLSSPIKSSRPSSSGLNTQAASFIPSTGAAMPASSFHQQSQHSTNRGPRLCRYGVRCSKRPECPFLHTHINEYNRLRRSGSAAIASHCTDYSTSSKPGYPQNNRVYSPISVFPPLNDSSSLMVPHQHQSSQHQHHHPLPQHQHQHQHQPLTPTHTHAHLSVAAYPVRHNVSSAAPPSMLPALPRGVPSSLVLSQYQQQYQQQYRDLQDCQLSTTGMPVMTQSHSDLYVPSPHSEYLYSSMGGAPISTAVPVAVAAAALPVTTTSLMSSVDPSQWGWGQPKQYQSYQLNSPRLQYQPRIVPPTPRVDPVTAPVALDVADYEALPASLFSMDLGARAVDDEDNEGKQGQNCQHANVDEEKTDEQICNCAVKFANCSDKNHTADLRSPKRSRRARRSLRTCNCTTPD